MWNGQIQGANAVSVAAEFDRWLAERDAQVAAQALLDAAESNDLIDHMYSHIGGHGLNSPAAVRATATYLHHRADQIQGAHDE